MAKNMNAVFKMLALGMAVVLIAGCSDAANTGQSKESVNPFGKHIKPKQDLLSLKRQAEAGDASAQFALGLRYFEGKGVAKDPAQALVWWRKAAEQGNSDAQYTLGEIYSDPSSFDILYDMSAKDATQAVAWYRKAAEQGNPGAQFKLGLMYDQGKGVPKDVVQAVLWFRKAAEQGDAIAQNNLGVMYDQG